MHAARGPAHGGATAGGAAHGGCGVNRPLCSAEDILSWGHGAEAARGGGGGGRGEAHGGGRNVRPT
eukprot:scaffold106075_cov33-Phaeocystis_antarctica.AAC.1